MSVPRVSMADNRIVYPINPERKAWRRDWWHDAPERELGGHDGLTDQWRAECSLDERLTLAAALWETNIHEARVAAAKLLDSRMREVRGSNRMAAVDRVAVLAALNLAHELQQLRDEQQARNREVERTLQDLHRKLDSALGTP